LLAVGAFWLAAGVWVLGAVLAVLGIAATWPFCRRCHRLARRWLVVVPAGLVVHDWLVLAETLLVQRAGIVRVGLALTGTGAADLTGPSGVHPVEIAVRDMMTTPFAPTRRDQSGRAIHAGAYFVAPTRPGRALADAARR